VKSIILFFTFYFLLFTFLWAQETWLQTYDPFDEAIFSVEDVLICSDGGYVVNGTCIDQDILIGWGFVLKTDSEGNMQWAKRDTVSFQPENDSRAFVETEDGGIISASYHYASGTALIKRDSDGNREWSYLLDDFAILSMDNTNNNNIIVAGYQNINNISLAMIAEFTENGEVIWSNYFDFENTLWSVIQAVRASSNEGYLLTGQVRYEETEDAILVIKTDSNGDSLWTRILDETSLNDQGKTIIETEEGDIIVGGYLEGITAGFLWKLDSEGNTIWLETGNESCGYGFRSFAKADDDFIVSIFGDLEINHSLRKFDSDYNINWTNGLPYNTGRGDKALGIIPEGNIVVSLYNPPYVGLIKLNSDGTNISENVINVSKTVLKAYPNPFNPTINFSFNLYKSIETEIKIFNIKGQKVETLTISKQQAAISWNAENYASGIYYCKLVNVETGKIMSVKKVSLLK
jgi:hypothetical protein